MWEWDQTDPPNKKSNRNFSDACSDVIRGRRLLFSGALGVVNPNHDQTNDTQRSVETITGGLCLDRHRRKRGQNNTGGGSENLFRVSAKGTPVSSDPIQHAH